MREINSEIMHEKVGPLYEVLGKAGGQSSGFLSSRALVTTTLSTLKLNNSVRSVMGKGYKALGEVTAEIKNVELLTKLNESSKGTWVKVYEAGMQKGTKIEIHYFRNNNTGKVFDVKTKYNHWHQNAFKKLSP